MKITVRCLEVRSTGRGPEQRNLSATFRPEIRDENDPRVKDGAVFINRDIVLEFSNAGGENLKAFVEGRDYTLAIEKAD
jgi:hypothetical protein